MTGEAASTWFNNSSKRNQKNFSTLIPPTKHVETESAGGEAKYTDYDALD